MQPGPTRRHLRHRVAAIAMGLLLSGASPTAPPAFAESAWTPSEANGRLIYREGRSASGGAIQARVGAGQASIPASAVPCANCHGADGRGRPEGGVRPPDITW